MIGPENLAHMHLIIVDFPSSSLAEPFIPHGWLDSSWADHGIEAMFSSPRISIGQFVVGKVTFHSVESMAVEWILIEADQPCEQRP
jgi:hypothetical protein